MKPMNWINDLKIGTRLNLIMSGFILLGFLFFGIYVKFCTAKSNSHNNRGEYATAAERPSRGY